MRPMPKVFMVLALAAGMGLGANSLAQVPTALAPPPHLAASSAAPLAKPLPAMVRGPFPHSFAPRLFPFGFLTGRRLARWAGTRRPVTSPSTVQSASSERFSPPIK